ncbi:MAG: outer membrane lipoprotein LolB [Gammaproteobacteria bacterium]|nr:outer membrane lipoprotein LolB [Gammaproteobacteria bacterium]
MLRNAAELLAKRWGYQLPVSYLQYWIKGIPVPKLATSHESLRNGYYQSFMQQGWQVNIQEYAQFSGIELPKRITISSAALRSKMVIYNWQRG